MADLLEASKSPTTLLELKQRLRGVKHVVRNIILAPEIIFRLYLKKKYGYKGGKPADYPSASWHNAVLRTQQEIQEVIEHGVDVLLFFQEAARLLKPNGLLIVSTDYYSEPIDTRGLKAYGVPVHIFSKDEMLKVLHTAQECGLELTGPINLDCRERPVSWKEFQLDYTFVTFTLRKIGQ